MANLTSVQVEEIKRNGLFDFISNNYHEFSKSELADLFKEYNYAVYEINKELELKSIDKFIENIDIEDDE